MKVKEDHKLMNGKWDCKHCKTKDSVPSSMSIEVTTDGFEVIYYRCDNCNNLPTAKQIEEYHDEFNRAIKDKE